MYFFNFVFFFPGPPVIATQLQLPTDDDFFKVFVSTLENPGHFWVQPITKHSSDLEALTQSLGHLYSGSETDFVLNGFKVGDLCCAPFEFDDSWYRAKILETCEDGMVDLYYVDFGDTGKVRKEKLRQLKYVVTL